MGRVSTALVLADPNLSRSPTMYHPLLYEAMARDRMRSIDEQRHRELVRRLAVLRRRQRRADAARRAVQMLTVG